MSIFYDMSILELLVVTSLVCQIGAVVFAFFLLRRKLLSQAAKRPWRWFLISLIITLLRRSMAFSRYSLDYGCIELEYIVTIIISLCWIMVVYSFLSNSHVKDNNKK
jgi:hypothetical protein